MSEVNYSTVIIRNADKRLEELPLLGKTMPEWVALAAAGSRTTFAEDTGDNIAETVRTHLDDSEYTVVLYTDTPLIQKKTVLEAVGFCAGRKLNVARFTRGYVFLTAYLRRAESVLAAERYYLSEEEDFITAADFKQAAFCLSVLRQRILDYHMQRGVFIADPNSVTIEGDVQIAPGVRIYGNNTLTGKTRILTGARLNSGNTLADCVIGADCEITSSIIRESAVGAGTKVGPYAHIRPECIIGENCKIGDFVEIKKSRLGSGTKVSHLAYVGDAEIGANCNIGCGVVFANYDGKRKHRTTIGDNVFIGSNSNLVAPLIIGSNTFIAAGSTITDNIQKGLAIARARQVNKPDWQRRT